MAALREVGAGHVKIVPDIQVGGDGGGVIGGLGALLMRNLSNTGTGANGDAPATPEPQAALPLEEDGRGG